jgi:hypothetical protein
VKKLPALIMLMWAAALIAGMDIYALSQGVNGTLFSVSVATIAALGAGFAGFRIGKR